MKFYLYPSSYSVNQIPPTKETKEKKRDLSGGTPFKITAVILS